MEIAHKMLEQMQKKEMPTFEGIDGAVEEREALQFAVLKIVQQPRLAAYMSDYFRSISHLMREVGEAYMPGLFVLWLDHMVRVYKIDDTENIINYDALYAILNAVSDVMHLPGTGAKFVKEDKEFVPRLRLALEARRAPKQNRLLVEEICREIEMQAADVRG